VHGLNVIAENSYVTEDGKRLTIVPEMIDCGSFMSYAVGYDYYASVTEKKKDLCTFSILANPKTDGLPVGMRDAIRNMDIAEITANEAIKVCESKYEDFIYDDKVIVGGFKNQTLFARYGPEELIEKIKEVFGARKIISKNNKESLESEDR
jgi:hypothetical protein